MKPWNALFDSRVGYSPRHRAMLGFGLLVALCLMAVYVQLLYAHTARASQVRLSPGTPAIQAAALVRPAERSQAEAQRVATGSVMRK